MSETEHDALQHHLDGIHGALLSVARHLESDEATHAICSQLEWAASHLNAALRELRGEGVDSRAVAQDDPDADAEVRPGGLLEGLSGHAQSITIPEILGFVSSLRKSGVLRINTSREAFLIQLHEGSVVYAQGDSPPPGQLLGEILVTQGSLSQEALDRALKSESSSQRVLGRTLLGRGLVSEEALCIALTYQVQHVFHRVFAEEDAVFQFDEGVRLLAPEDIRLNVTSLLLESARSSDEELREALDGGLGLTA